jgi:hypothetical protein
MYAEEYGGFGGGFSNANFRMGQGGGQAGRFDGRGNRFADRSANNRGNGRSRATGTRDFIDPWAQTANPNSQLIGSNFGSLNDSSLINNGNSNNGSSIDMENKSSTQVTIPKDVSY